ncbi:nuclear transport factor 2 family protein [Streptacidiphilus cavernicola]|uniref:Nuclear transport factor 2 family protein n=1 Tax=Streptacidiphilus cavernicola TaxID=3342716 RepID=A0ABV6VQW2_9ACTN
MPHTDRNKGLHPVLVRQLAAIESRDLDGLMENYLPDAALLRFEGAWVGTAALRELFTGYLTLEPVLIDLTEYVEADDTVFYRAAVGLGGAVADTFGTLVVREGRIWRQTVAFVDGS